MSPSSRDELLGSPAQSAHSRETQPSFAPSHDLEWQIPHTVDHNNHEDTRSSQETTDLFSPCFKQFRVQDVGAKLGPRYIGWRFGILLFAIAGTITFCLNLSATLWALLGPTNGEVFAGDCKESKMRNRMLHVVINILSTTLLAGSNYCMQCMSAPTRQEIDKLHQRNIWLEIGVPSIRNLIYISPKRLWIWLLLGLSSLPLHLIYNSAVFGSLASNDYVAYSVSRSFIDNSTCLECENLPGDAWNLDNDGQVLTRLWERARSGHLRALTPQQCKDIYAADTPANFRNLLIVADDGNFPGAENNAFKQGSHVYWRSTMEGSHRWQSDLPDSDPFSWICTGLYGFNAKCSDIHKFMDVTKWKVGANYTYSWPVGQCFSEHNADNCRVLIEPTIATVVTVVNFVKALLMFYVAFFMEDEPLATLGDAIESFLDLPDTTTVHRCLEAKQGHWAKEHRIESHEHEWDDPQKRWKDMTSSHRRFTTFFLTTLSLIAVLALLLVAVDSLLSKNISARDVDFGAEDPRTLLNFRSTFLHKVIVANCPQLALSFMYYNYNALYTSMLNSYEWVSYGTKRKGLRVSHVPKGEQRTTYFLQLPYRFSLPLILVSIALHWLMNQSLFLVVIDFYDVNGVTKRPTGDAEGFGLITLGYSPLAIIIFLVLSLLLMLTTILSGFTPYRRGMPMAGSSSKAISAACHVNGEEEPAQQKLQWGVVSTDDRGIGHCSFSSKPVRAPVRGDKFRMKAIWVKESPEDQ